MKIFLALHTTTETLESAIATIPPLEFPLDPQHIKSLQSSTDTNQDDPDTCGFLKQQAWHLGRELSTQVHVCLAEFMQGINWTDIGGIAIAKGVGSFTGTRIGVVLARTLGEQLGVPVYAIDCEEIAARSQCSQPPKSLSYSLLEIAYSQWQQGIQPHWSEAIPKYGNP